MLKNSIQLMARGVKKSRELRATIPINPSKKNGKVSAALLNRVENSKNTSGRFLTATFSTLTTLIREELTKAVDTERKDTATAAGTGEDGTAGSVAPPFSSASRQSFDSSFP
jgi:hypothetical protein